MDEAGTVIARLYELVRTRNAAAVGALLDEHFDSDVVLHEPVSLPWGGDHVGLSRVKRMFVGIAAAPPEASPMRADSITVTRIAAGSTEVAVELAFTLVLPGHEPAQTGAIEWFTFTEGKVVGVRATYFEKA